MELFRTGFAYGTGSALNVQLGWIPDRVEIINATDGDVLNIGFPAIVTMAFTSGGTNEIKAGHTIVGATSGARGRVRQVLADTGTWAGGDAAGTLILDADTVTGTFASESVYYVGSSSLNDATGAAIGTPGVDSDTELASDTGVSAYLGTDAGNSKGFTLASGISEDAKLLIWSAWRNLA
jgi:hypothetical protein